MKAILHVKSFGKKNVLFNIIGMHKNLKTGLL
ncbi:MAG: hypothetical protein ACI9M9_000729 [Flavobacteriaceae bacterium]|jgi:hypothetical protein